MECLCEGCTVVLSNPLTFFNVVYGLWSDRTLAEPDRQQPVPRFSCRICWLPHIRNRKLCPDLPNRPAKDGLLVWLGYQNSARGACDVPHTVLQPIKISITRVPSQGSLELALMTELAIWLALGQALQRCSQPLLERRFHSFQWWGKMLQRGGEGVVVFPPLMTSLPSL